MTLQYDHTVVIKSVLLTVCIAMNPLKYVTSPDRCFVLAISTHLQLPRVRQHTHVSKAGSV